MDKINRPRMRLDVSLPKRSAIFLFLARQDLNLLVSYLEEWIASDMSVGLRPNKRLVRMLEKFKRAHERALGRAA